MAIVLNRSYPCALVQVPEAQVYPDTDRYKLFPGINSWDVAVQVRASGREVLRLGQSGLDTDASFDNVAATLSLFRGQYLFIRAGNAQDAPTYKPQIVGEVGTFIDAIRPSGGGIEQAYAGIQIPIDAAISGLQADGEVTEAYVITSPGRTDSDGVIQAMVPGEVTEPMVTSTGTATILEHLISTGEPARRENLTIAGEQQTIVVEADTPVEGIECEVSRIVWETDTTPKASVIRQGSLFRIDGGDWRFIAIRQTSSGSRIVDASRTLGHAS